MFVGQDPLASATRRRICEYVTKQPGLHLRAVARGVKLDTNHTKYHLTYLEQHGLVTSERVHGYWAFYPNDGAMASGLGDLDSSEKAQLFLVRKDVPRRVVTKLLEVDEANHKVLQEAAGVSASTLYYHLRRMADKEMVISRKQGPARLWKLNSPDLTRRLLKVSGSDDATQVAPEPPTQEPALETVGQGGNEERGEERWQRRLSPIENEI